MNEREDILNEEDTIDVLEILRSFWQHKWFILLLAVLCSAAVYVKMAYFTENTYSAKGILYISNKNDTVAQNEIVQKNDIDASRSLSMTYIEILKTESFLDDVANGIPELSGEELSKVVSISSINETELLQISATTDSGYLSYKIVNIILERAPQKLKGIYKNGEVEIVDTSKLPKIPDSKGTVKKTLIGAIAGMIIAAAIIVIRGFMDTKVRNGDQAAKRYSTSVLGELPRIEM